MAVLIRTLLVWLLVLAIPAQGVAAATMAFCGPVHRGGVAAAAASHDAAAGHLHGSPETALAHHHPSAEADAPPADGVGMAATGRGDSADPHKCSVCGSCCSTGALMSTVPTVPAVADAATVFTAVVATVDPFAADGPDRPPRNRLV